MKDSRKKNKTSNGNKHNNGKASVKDGVASTDLTPVKVRMTLRMPINSETYALLGGVNNGNASSYFEKLEKVVQNGVKKPEQEVEEQWDTFCSFFGKRFPDGEIEIRKLWPYILKRGMYYDDLSDEYFESLKAKGDFPIKKKGKD